MDTLSTQEMLEKLGLKSYETLRRWRAAGLIGDPQVVTHPNGRGRIAKWPQSILVQCLAIKERLLAGDRLDQLAPQVKKRQYVFSDDMKQRDRKLALLRLRDGALKSLRRFGRYCISSLEVELITFDHLTEAQKLNENRECPLLVVTVSRAVVIAKRRISELLDGHPQLGICVVIPVDQFLVSNDGHVDE